MSLGPYRRVNPYNHEFKGLLVRREVVFVNQTNPYFLTSFNIFGVRNSSLIAVLQYGFNFQYFCCQGHGQPLKLVFADNIINNNSNFVLNYVLQQLLLVNNNYHLLK